ncbi:hypothetical protein SAMN05421788_1011100 [Filimonas lacunae]|uniref:Lipoprotein n=1 Tax=Filimonas lacunae TaxID=477680 RepID=A0A173MQE5_9BACT|nr:hypothetical protein [Filimonas lacunae]BAV09669.1 hypothetical protein FLA_5720 [Filimonas lacunae]SIS76895.1 hypothetical protein SAMN05421788_1011100 [Filimonas lacunae]
MRPTSTITAIALSVAVLTGCKCNNNKQQAQEEKAIELDSSQTALSIIQEDSAMVFDDTNTPWVKENFIQKGFDWKGFKLISFWAEDSVEKKPVTTAPDFYTHYASVLKWSPDSSFVLDFGSYGGVVTSDSNGKSIVAKGEPDTEVSILYPKESKKSRILFSGPALHIINATWADSSQVAMLGTLDTSVNGNKPDTLLWMIDVREHFFRKYKWH